MADLPETDTYPAGVYQYEVTTPAVGGAPNRATMAGAMNVPLLDLANRTKWLKTRVDQLIGTVVVASTAVAGIVRLSTSTSSTATDMAATPSAVKSANDNANTRAMNTTTITGSGLATGGGTLAANRVIDVPAANQAEAEAGAIDTKAMTPLRVAQAIAAKRAGFGAIAVTITAWNDAIENGIYFSLDAADGPTTGQFLGLVEARAITWVTQTVHQYTGDSPADTRTYRRSRDNGVWGAWYRLRISEAEQASLWAAIGTTIATTGLATGGGTLATNRVIDVPTATQAEAEAGAIDTKAMTPLRVAQYLAARIAAGAAQAGSAVLTAISALASNGFIVRTAAGTVAVRSMTAGTGVTVTNGDGVAGNPTVALTIATQAEAEAGAIDTKAMTPLRVAQLVGVRLAANCIGSGQTWVNVTADRSFGTTYQNTTGRPIMVSISGDGSSVTGGKMQVSADETTWVDVAVSGPDVFQVAVIVPGGAFYRAYGGDGMDCWAELR